MEGEGGQGLLLIAFLVIAFINWVSNSLKERAEQREAAKRRQRQAQSSQERSDGRHEEAWPEPEPAAIDPSQQLRDFFDSLAGNPPAQRQTPTPEPAAATRETA